MFQVDDINRQLLNQSEKFSQQDYLHQRRGDHPQPPTNKLYCQICAFQRPLSDMYTISEHCESSHRFCVNCLTKKVEESINKNEDIYCPIDYCPCILSQSCRFFSKMPNSVHNKYVIWKSSKQYLQRNQSFRESRKSVQPKYFNYFPNNEKEVEIKFEQMPEEQKLHLDPEVEPYKQRKEKKKRENKKKENKKKQKKENKDMKVGVVNVQKKEEIMQEQVMVPIKAAVVPVPFHEPPKPIKNEKQIKYTCFNRVIKVFYVVFGLPMLLLLMALLIASIFVIYAFMLVTFAGSLILITAAVYFLITGFSTQDIQLQKQSLTYAYLLSLIWLACLGFSRFFSKNFNYINYLVITNSWMWWIKKLIGVWAYPSPAPALHLTPNISA